MLAAGFLPRAQEAIIDMSGPAAPMSPLAATHNLVVEFAPADGASWEAVDTALRRGLVKLAAHLAEAALDAQPDAIEELPDLLPDADVVVLVVPGTRGTRHLVDAEFLARMRSGALLVNVSRGSVVDQDALADALHDGRVRAAIDVTDPEPLPTGHRLWRAPNLLISPHVGGASSAMWPRAHRLVRDQLHRYAHGETLSNVVGLGLDTAVGRAGARPGLARPPR